MEYGRMACGIAVYGVMACGEMVDGKAALVKNGIMNYSSR